MRIILHIGTPKSGSTALQTALVAARGKLKKLGILYPKCALNHNFMEAGVVPPDRISRVFAQRYRGDADAMASDFAEFWNRIVEGVARHQPRVLLLSAESLFNAIGAFGPAALRALLAPLGARTEVVCYVRRPSDYYLSMAQQQLKASYVLRPVGAIAYRKPLEAAAAAADGMHVIPYERTLFPGGDVVADFATRFLPEAGTELCSVAEGNIKTSMSAEAMDIVRAFRRDRHPEENDRFTSDTGLLIRRIGEREAELGGKRRPELLPEVRTLIDRATVDLLWLRDVHGVVFPGVDYAAIAPTPGFHPQAVGEICRLDAERRDALAGIVDEVVLASPGGEQRKKFRIAYNQNRSS
jgi:hypothetical protein